jgi:hypothetical protein
MDLDYRVLSNAGVWFVGRLQTDADRERVVEAMSSARVGGAATEGADAFDPSVVTDTVKRLAPRWFVVRNVHRRPSTALLQSRTTLSWLRGPMTRADLRRLREREGGT